MGGHGFFQKIQNWIGNETAGEMKDEVPPHMFGEKRAELENQVTIFGRTCLPSI